MLTLAVLAACKSDPNVPPVAQDSAFSAVEDESISGRLSAVDPEGEGLRFSVLSARHGSVTSLTDDGQFTFVPETDFFGTASFVFGVTDGHGLSGTGLATITVENVNDAPRLADIPDLGNSPETELLEHQLLVIDPDPAPQEHAYTISVADPTILEASVDSQLGRVFLKALRIGTTDVVVTVADAQYSDSTQFRFSAEEVVKGRVLRYEEAQTGAVVLANETERPIDFALAHNGFPVFEDVDSIVRHVHALPREFDGEDFPRKLWRFVRDSVYHELPLETTTSITQNIFYDPWFTLNSLGWGLCGHVAGIYVVIAEAAGYEARVWGLNGHVVPEIRVDGRWRMYDPDLSVYYKNPDGTVAGVEELASNPSLITSPHEPIFAGSSYQFPYHPFIADIYSSTSDNFDGAAVFLPEHSTPSARIVLPPRSRLTYPGVWTAPPPARDGSLAYDVRAYRQASIELGAGWTGQLQLPWMAWQITGSGQVGIDGESFVVGSAELDERLRDTPSPITTMDVYANDGIRVVLFVNAVQFDIAPRTTVTLQGLNVWGIHIGRTQLPPENGAGGSLDTSLVKPLPTVIR